MSTTNNQLPDHPENRGETYLARMAGQDVQLPDHPSSRMEEYLAYIAEHSGGAAWGEITGTLADQTDLATALSGKATKQEVMTRVSAISAWNQELLAGSVTPAITIPAPDTTKVQEITYIFTAATANATFTAPSGWIICNADGTAGLSAGNSLTYTDLTVGSIYECSFKPISASVIRLVMAETKTA